MQTPPLFSASTTPGDAAERRLLALFRGLSADQQKTVLAFVEFLAARPAAEAETEPPTQWRQPRPAARPQGESVIAAIKRLRTGYPMLAPQALLNGTSRLMSEHVLQGRSADAVIDELEAFFQTQYAQWRAGDGSQ